MREAEVVNAARIIVGKDNRIVLWPNPVGHAIYGREHKCPRCSHCFRDEKPRRVAYGIGGDGGADYIGIVRSTGRFIAWEFKGDGGRVAPEQKQFLELVSNNGGASEVIWTPDDVPAAIERAVSP